MLLTHTHEEFATLATLQKDHTCPPYRDVSGWHSSAPPKYNTMSTGNGKALRKFKSVWTVSSKYFSLTRLFRYSGNQS